MKRIIKYSVFLLGFLILAACDDPNVLLSNIVHKDGSITRKIVMTWDKPDFDLEGARVPIDTSWLIERSSSVSENMDTIYTLTAEKTFASVQDINDRYIAYGGSNSKMKRWTEFDKKFKWFTTEYRYSENIEKAINGYPPEDYMNKEELNLFYMPDKIRNDLKNGEDSLLYREKFDSLDTVEEIWLCRSLVKAAILEVEKLIDDFPESTITTDLMWENEELFGDIVFSSDLDVVIDSVFGKGTMNKNEIMLDSAISCLEDQFAIAFEAASYLVQTKMHGELTQTNGYIDTDGNIVWTVDGEVFLSKDYSMWAESVETNWWAWILSGIFILFVIVGFVKRKK